MYRLLIMVMWASLASATCVRAVFPFSKEAPTQMVLDELAKKHVDAHVCTDQPEETEIYFYPLNISLSPDETIFWIDVQPTSTGVVGDISTYTPHWNDQVWVVAVHPWGETESSKRETGYSLKSQSGKVGKWLQKGNNVHF